jgi:hypothetical protein
MKLQLRIGGHETFYPRDRWFYKGIREIKTNKKDPENSVDENDYYPTDRLGVGVNMVKSISYWLRAAGMINSAGNDQSDWVKRIRIHDEFLDSHITNWILHYRLIINDNGPSVWKWFFSESNLTNFTKDQWIFEARNFLEKQYGKEVSEKSLAKEFSVLTGMYCSDLKRDLFYPSPFLFMNQISYNAHMKTYVRNSSPGIPADVLFYMIYDFQKINYPDSSLLDIDKIRRVSYSPLRIFRLETEDVYQKYSELSQRTAESFHLSRSAGMNLLTIKEVDENKLITSLYKFNDNDVRLF